MMTIDLHSVLEINAITEEGQHWVEFCFESDLADPEVITVFFRNAEIARRYADAINQVAQPALTVEDQS